MDTSDNTAITPRRSMRLQKQRALTPDISLRNNSFSHIIGPRELMKLNKSKSNTQVPDINVVPPTPTDKKLKKKARSKSESVDNYETAINITTGETTKEEYEKMDETSAKNYAEVVKSIETEKNAPESQFTETESVATAQNEKVSEGPSTKFENVSNGQIDNASNWTIDNASNGPVDNASNVPIDNVTKSPQTKTVPQSPSNVEETNLKLDKNETPQLLDESIVSIPDSPPKTNSIAIASGEHEAETSKKIKDSTFSPEVDTSITDSRPHIDAIFDASPCTSRKGIVLRTSTPLSQRVLMRETPKLTKPVIDALKKIMSPKPDTKINDASLNSTFNGQIKIVNPLEKSILKSSRRKRSMSVTDGESFMQRKVFFVSPEVMNIDKIDEKMLQSFKEEKEHSFKQQTSASGGARRKRSLSASGTPRFTTKVPNFKKIHEQQFNKMESIADQQQRKVDRAKRLVTPSKTPLTTVPEAKEKIAKESKIPTRRALIKMPSSENIFRTSSQPGPSKVRSNSVDKPVMTHEKKKIFAEKKPSALPRILDENKSVNVSSFTAKTTATSAAAKMRGKVEERREKNMSLYKGNGSKVGIDLKKKNENVLKGVRLNRRFELQMKHRRMEETNE